MKHSRIAWAFLLVVGLIGVANAVVLTGTDSANQNMVVKGGFFRLSVTDNITAFATGGQTNATPLVSAFNRVVTVANANDSVLLPPCVSGIGGDTLGYGNTDGMQVIVANSHASNAINVYPQTGQGINAIAVNSPFTLSAGKTIQFTCSPAGIWYGNLSA